MPSCLTGERPIESQLGTISKLTLSHMGAFSEKWKEKEIDNPITSSPTGAQTANVPSDTLAKPMSN